MRSNCQLSKPFLTCITAKCKLCTELGADCLYREPGVKLDSGDRLILDRLAQIEGLIQNSLVPAASIVTSKFDSHSPALSNRSINEPMHSGASVTSSADSRLQTSSANISTMPKEHTTPALNLLQWPKIRDLVSRPYDSQVLLRLEMSRPSLKLPDFPRPDMTINSTTYVAAYFKLVHVWYACVNPYSWKNYFRIGAAAGFSHGPESCVVLLVLALGSAAKSGSITDQPPGRDPPGLDYFAAGWKLLPSLLIRNDLIAIQCQVLAAAYLFYLVRPLQAWNMLANASMKLQLLLSHPGHHQSAESELSKRLFWNIVLGESNLLAELDLPHLGIVVLEETVGLPGPFQDTGDEAAGEDSIWYFLAEIALRRLLNRVSTLIYADTKTTVPPLTSKLARIVTELEFQLEQFCEGLPGPMKFPRERASAATPAQICLRMRYLAGRTIIFRPYVLAVLADESVGADAVVQEKCRKCLDACVSQIDNIHTQ